METKDFPHNLDYKECDYDNSLLSRHFSHQCPNINDKYGMVFIKNISFRYLLYFVLNRLEILSTDVHISDEIVDWSVNTIKIIVLKRNKIIDLIHMAYEHTSSSTCKLLGCQPKIIKKNRYVFSSWYSSITKKLTTFSKPINNTTYHEILYEICSRLEIFVNKLKSCLKCSFDMEMIIEFIEIYNCMKELTNQALNYSLVPPIYCYQFDCEYGCINKINHDYKWKSRENNYPDSVRTHNEMNRSTGSIPRTRPLYEFHRSFPLTGFTNYVNNIQSKKEYNQNNNKISVDQTFYSSQIKSSITNLQNNNIPILSLHNKSISYIETSKTNEYTSIKLKPLNISILEIYNQENKLINLDIIKSTHYVELGASKKDK